MVKIISAVIFALFIFQAWTNIQEVNLVREQKKSHMFAPVKQYLSNYINNLEGTNSNIVFSNFKTKTVTPGKNIIGTFDLSYDQAKNNKELASRAFFKGTIELTSIDGKDWISKITEIKNVRQDFIEPMYIKASTN